MSEKTFEDRDSAAHYLASHLPAELDTTQRALATTAFGLVDLFRETGFSVPVEADARRAVIPSLRWVIRNDDLALIDALGKVVTASATGGVALVSTGSLSLGAAPPALEILFQLVKVGKAVRAKGATLEPNEFQVLMALRSHAAGLSIGRLQEILPNHAPFDSEDSLEALLHHLDKFPTRSGGVSLVWRSADQLWRARDI